MIKWKLVNVLVANVKVAAQLLNAKLLANTTPVCISAVVLETHF